MTNHVHLLMTPDDDVGISRVMQHLGRRYVQYINKTYRRSGTLWEGRHKGSLVDADNYLLKCYRYIEMNPVAACMVDTPEQYRWSSYGWHAWGKPNDIIADHFLYENLDKNLEKRRYIYRDLFKHHIPEKDLHAIKEGLKFNYPLGSDRFKEQLEFALGRTVGEKKRGRPKALVDIG